MLCPQPALRDQVREAVRPWRDYIWLLLHALYELPLSAETVVFRGCKKSPAELELELTAGFDYVVVIFVHRHHAGRHANLFGPVGSAHAHDDQVDGGCRAGFARLFPLSWGE